MSIAVRKADQVSTIASQEGSFKSVFNRKLLAKLSRCSWKVLSAYLI
jgi:hypothetical protein